MTVMYRVSSAHTYANIHSDSDSVTTCEKSEGTVVCASESDNYNSKTSKE